MDPKLPENQQPTTPTEPQQPAIPSTPTEPVQPVTPTEPSVPTQPTQPAVPTAPVTPAVDEEKVAKSIIDKIAEGLGITKKEEKAQIPTDPDGLAKFVEDKSAKTVQKVLEDREQAEKDAQETQEKSLAEGAKRFQDLWTSQYNELAESGRLPKVTNAGDLNDPGNQAKTKILTKLKQVLDENQAKGVDYVPTLKEIFYEFPDVLRTDTVAGANAPVSGGGRAVANSGQGLPYDNLHKTDIEDLVRAKYN